MRSAAEVIEAHDVPLKIVIAPGMAGWRHAVYCRGTLVLSPAMWKLLDAPGEEVVRMLRAIPCVEVPRLDLATAMAVG